MENELKNLLELKELIDDQTVETRIRLYRWLASVTEFKRFTHELLQMAAELEEIEKRSREFNLQISQNGDGK